jgi:hypothetical protein
MKIVRVYSDASGTSRFEHLTFESRPELKSLPAAAKNVNFSVWPAGHLMELHPAPRRQLVIVLDGLMEIGLEDGTSEVFGAGDVLMAEDTSGRGHTLRIPGDKDRVAIAVPLAD